MSHFDGHPTMGRKEALKAIRKAKGVAFYSRVTPDDGVYISTPKAVAVRVVSEFDDTVRVCAIVTDDGEVRIG